MFAENLSTLRVQNEVSQQELADYLQIKRNAISRYETGEREPDLSTLIKVSDFFNITLDELVRDHVSTLNGVLLSKNAFGERLQQLRKSKKISQQQLADDLHINRGTYAHYEINKRQPDYDILIKIADYFHVSVDYLLGNQKPISALALSKTTSVFGHMLQQLRKNKKSSQTVLSKELGVAQSTVGMWESGKREPDYDTLIRIAKYFHVSVDYLLGNQFTPDSENSNRNKDSSLTKEEIQTFSNEVQTALNKLLKSLQQEDEA